jgi:hypothetical protein
MLRADSEETVSTPIVIPIENPSFTEGTTGWQFAGGGGVAQVNGRLVAYAGYKSSFSQTLAASPSKVQQSPILPAGYYVEGVYALKFSVANFFPAYPGYFTVEIDYGSQELGESSGWGTAAFNEVTLVWASPGYIIADKALPDGGPVQGAQNFTLHFTVNDGSANGGWTLLFTDISLTFTPNL